jgi:hypothetical protein
LKLDPYFTPCKNHSKWIKDLNVRLKTLKIWGRNIGKILEKIGIDADLLRK